MIIDSLKNIIRFLRWQDFYHAGIEMKNGISLISRMISESEKLQRSEQLSETLAAVLNAQEKKDYVRMADIIEGDLIPFFSVIEDIEMTEDYLERNLQFLDNHKLVEAIRKRACDIQGNKLGSFEVQLSSTGYYTLKSDHYYHSLLDPKEEAFVAVGHYAELGIVSFAVFGFGLGYHTEEFLQYDERFSVTVLETELDRLTLAFFYRDLSAILKSARMRLIYMPEDQLDMKELSMGDEVLVVHYPTWKDIRNIKMAEVIWRYFITTNSMFAHGKLLRANFYYNIRRGDSNAEVLLPKLSGKQLIFCGAGPSLEDNISYIKARSMDPSYIITCASTTYQIMVKSGIHVDFIFLTEANHLVRDHFVDVADTDVLIYVSTASHMATDIFRGEAYIVLQEGYDEAEQYAKAHGYHCFKTGDNVAALAIDFILSSKAKSLTTIGMDFAFTDGKLHAFGNEHSEGDLEVPSVDGGLVATSVPWDLYRRHIEKRIEKENRPLYNISRGAYIRGMVNKTRWDFS